MSDIRRDLESTEASIRRDADRLDELERTKQSLEPGDPQLVDLSEQVERVATDVHGKAAAERDLAADLERDEERPEG